MKKLNVVLNDSNVMKEFLDSNAYKILLVEWNRANDSAMDALLDMSLDEATYPFKTRQSNVNMIKAWIDLPNAIIKKHEVWAANKKQEEEMLSTKQNKGCLQRG